MISSSQRPLPDNTQQSQNIHAPGGILTHNLSRRAAEDLRLRPRGHWDRPLGPAHIILNKINNNVYISFERVFKYLGKDLKDQNSIQEEIVSRLKSGNACYPSVQNLLSSSLLSKNLKIKVYGTIIVLVVLYGCETWSLTLREGRRLRVLENRVLRRIFGPKRDEVTGEWRKLHNEELNDLYCSPNFVRVKK